MASPSLQQIEVFAVIEDEPIAFESASAHADRELSDKEYAYMAVEDEDYSDLTVDSDVLDEASEADD
jgi:hypothetical protein